MPVGMEVGLSPREIVLDRDRATSPKRGQSPQFASHVYCCQMAAWIKRSLGTEVGLGPDDIVLDGDPAPLSEKGCRAPNFPPIFIVAKRLDASRCHLVWR